MKIEFLYFEGCPHANRALKLLRRVLGEEGVAGAEIVMTEVNSAGEAEKTGFPGSPSIRINGADIEQGRENDPAMMGCRLYTTEEGTRGYPSREMIAEAIRRAV